MDGRGRAINGRRATASAGERFAPAPRRCAPAFLVGANFHTILRYNNSTSYALAVGLLAQQLMGGPAVQTPWPRDLLPLTRSELLALQTALNACSFDCGVPDGTMGPATQRGVRQYQPQPGLGGGRLSDQGAAAAPAVTW